MRRSPFRLAAFVVAGTLVTGCSTVVSGTATPDPEALEIRLNTGGLPTEPRTPETSNTQQKVLAANELADRMVLPTDLDPSFTRPGMLSVRAVVQSGNLKNTLEDADAERIGQRGLLYGFVSGRNTSAEKVDSGITMIVLRMTDDGAASGVVDDFRSKGGGSEVVDGRTEWAVRKAGPKQYQDYTVFTAYMAIGPLVVIAVPWADDEARARGMVPRAMDAQARLLAGFTSAGRAELAGLPADKEAIVSYTVAPEPIEAGKFESDYGFRGRRAALHWDSSPVETAKLFEEVGMDLAGVGRNTVFRAGR
ncbi:hypothetical protein [Tsukamurella sp. PLM1]|uniref:DUF7373 family lipoprotein n=1 Tax=Tsukamurella sp. PLM1 TaxID=2929795 RepID=UPI002063A7ED|nr:hypothetical protein [Tsukamurella sp. PLM1]BDH55928.1 hypothetical protein MTP03_08670 [Tsukamurella sp. PLM1]